jgi:PKD repeat protein
LTWLKTQYFNSSVNKSPNAFWKASHLGLKVTFSGAKSLDFDGSIASYQWNFGDGSSGTSVTATRTYAAAGTYTVTLTVTDNQGLTATYTDQVAIDSVTKPIGYCR